MTKIDGSKVCVTHSMTGDSCEEDIHYFLCNGYTHLWHIGNGSNEIIQLKDYSSEIEIDKSCVDWSTFNFDEYTAYLHEEWALSQV